MSVRDESTFVVRVTAQENQSWQGQITWVDTGDVKNFRSAMEMLKLMEGAIEHKDLEEENI